MFNGLASINRSARGGERYLPCPGSIPELAETSSKKTKKKKKINYSPKTPCLTSSITKCVTINRTTTAINHGIDLHAYLHKKNSEFTPREIAKDVPSICIVDNDEFKIDTLTDNSQQAYQTNFIFVQHQSTEHKTAVEKNSHSAKKAEISKQLKENARELTKVTQYIASRGASLEPLVCRHITTPINGFLPHKKRSVIYALARVDSNVDQPDKNQPQVPAYSSMQACLNQVGERSKAYYQSTYLEIPSKSVINDIMVKSVDGIKHYIFVYGQRLTNRFTFC